MPTAAVFLPAIEFSLFALLQVRRSNYCLTVSWLVTLSGLPATSAALEAIEDFSSSECTGPLSVTIPSLVMIFTLCPYVESDLSAISDCRIFLVNIRSEVASDCWSAVWLCALLVAELSGLVMGALLWSWQNAAVGSTVRQAIATHP